MKYLLGGDSLTAFVKGKPYNVNRTAKIFNAALEAVKNDDEEKFLEVFNTKEEIVRKSNGKVQLKDGQLFYGDRQVTGLIASRIFEMLELNLSIDPMIKFIENLMQNPSKRAVDELFGFIDACDLPITEDGHFLAYKRIRSDYKDVHSGTMDNSVGKILEMPRNLVDEDKSRTCSAGLHCCSYEYLQHFSGERIVVVKVNPKDVVAVPEEYENSKMRVCRYEVVEEMQVQDNLPTVRLNTKYISDKKEKAKVKMTQELADELRSDASGWCPLTDAELCKKYNISKRQVNRILNNEAWVKSK